jgi:uncharacterized DUF497 family protein
MAIHFEWDEVKAQANLKKHKVSFELASCVFFDPLALVYQDRIENGELRWQTLGMVENCLVLLVAHAVQHDEVGEIIRIISARKADKKERKQYEENR